MEGIDAAMTAVTNSITYGYLGGLGFVAFVLLLRRGGR